MLDAVVAATRQTKSSLAGLRRLPVRPLALYKDLRRIAMADPGAFLMAGRALLPGRPGAGALRCLEDSACRRDDAEALLLLAALHEALGRPGEAQGLLLDLLARRPEETRAHTALARHGRPAAPEAFPALFLSHHLGLGDHLICNGLVRHIAAGTPSLGLFVKRHNETSVRFMFRDDPTIRLFPVRHDDDVNDFLRHYPAVPLVRIGFEKLDEKRHTFGEDFYAQAGLDYSDRWALSFVQRNPERERALFERLVGTVRPYLFLHDDPGRNLTIDRRLVPGGLPVIRPDRRMTDNIFDYGMILENAQEIHCMDSAFRHLADSLPRLTGRLILHHYVRGPTSDVPGRHTWERLQRT
ncbi:hypothetical protein [Azospirillum sp. sgz301742]